MKYRSEDVKWEVLPSARKVHEDVHSHLPEQLVSESVRGLRDLLCDYFSTCGACDQAALGISPMGQAPRGGRAFKVRWRVPGRGKSGGLRLAVIAMCPAKHIVIAAAWARSSDPGDPEFTAALNDVRAK